MSHLLEILGKALDNEAGDLLQRYCWPPQAQGFQKLQETCREHPDWPDVRFQLGMACLQASKLDEAVEHLSAACRRKPDYLAARIALAAAYEERGEAAKSLEHVKPEESVAIHLGLYYMEAEDRGGLPAAITLQAKRRDLLAAAKANAPRAQATFLKTRIE